MTPSFLFDFTLKKPKVTLIDEHSDKAAPENTKSSLNHNLCPYPIPTIEEINKLINSGAYR